MTNRANEPAMPVQAESYPARDGNSTVHETRGGLTIHEHFAGLAMQGMLASNAPLSAAQIAEYAPVYADALIAALESKP